MVKQFTNIPFNWTEYSAYLPEGTKHFAIRCISYNQYMLFVDDVKFIPANSDKKSVELSGYNVYRDGHRLNAEPMAENSYVDKDIDGISTYSYAVTAVYTEGESMKSNEISVDTSLTGIGSTMAGDVTISASAGAPIVTGAEGMRVEIFATDGTTVAALPGETHMSIDLQAGFYIVRVGNTVAKIAVR